MDIRLYGEQSKPILFKESFVEEGDGAFSFVMRTHQPHESIALKFTPAALEHLKSLGFSRIAV